MAAGKLPDDVPRAIDGPATSAALRARGRSIFYEGAGCGGGVLVLDWGLVHLSLGLFAYVVALGVLLLFVGFAHSLICYAGLIRVRRILRRNPWVEWYAKVTHLELRGFEVTRAVVLAHPEWHDTEIKFARPRVWAKQLESGSSTTMWVAGNPTKAVAMSPEGGALPMTGVNVWFAFLRKSILAKVGQ